MFLGLTNGQRKTEWRFPLRGLVFATLMVVLLTWIVMPLLIRGLRRWLHPHLGDYETESEASVQARRNSFRMPRKSISYSMSSIGGRLKCQVIPRKPAWPMRPRITPGNNSVSE